MLYLQRMAIFKSTTMKIKNVKKLVKIFQNFDKIILTKSTPVVLKTLFSIKSQSILIVNDIINYHASSKSPKSIFAFPFPPLNFKLPFPYNFLLFFSSFFSFFIVISVFWTAFSPNILNRICSALSSIDSSSALFKCTSI